MKLNPNLNIKDLNQQFTLHNRLHIPNFLDNHEAHLLFKYIKSFKQWSLSLNSGSKHFDIDHITRQDMTAELYQKLEGTVGEDALLGFQYFFENYPIYDVYHRGGCSSQLASFFEFINSHVFLNCIRSITDIETIKFADAQLTKYSKGHFLTSHDDDVIGKNRRIAYVLSLTPEWCAHWGGLLQFHGSGGNIQEAYSPTFNSLNIFSVPKLHSVSQIASYVKASRYSITGWLREGHDPKR